MVISSCQMIGYFSGITTLVGSIVVTALPDWKQNTVAGLENRVCLHGLWAKCYVRPTGYIECIPHASPFFALSTVFRGCRVLVIMASIIAFIGVATTPLGMQCTRIGGDRFTKARLARFGAFLFGISGILIGTAVSWFAEDIAREFDTKSENGRVLTSLRTSEKYVYGNSLFVGWGTMVMGIISCIFLALGSCERRVEPQISGLSVSSNSSRPLTSNTNGKERLRPVTPMKQAPKNKPSEYYSTSVTNGFAGGQPMTSLARPYGWRFGLQRQASVLSAPAKTTVIANETIAQQHHYKTYV